MMTIRRGAGHQRQLECQCCAIALCQQSGSWPTKVASLLSLQKIGAQAASCLVGHGPYSTVAVWASTVVTERSTALAQLADRRKATSSAGALALCSNISL
jgi:hypothetical protein